MTTHISLKFRHPYKDLTFLSSKLGLNVSRIWLVGDDRKTPHGDKLLGKYEESYCVLNIPDECKDINDAIKLVKATFDALPECKTDLFDKKLEKSLYCTLDGSGELIDLEAMQILINLEILLEID